MGATCKKTCTLCRPTGVVMQGRVKVDVCALLPVIARLAASLGLLVPLQGRKG